MKDNDDSKKPYAEPTLEKREKLVEITEGTAARISGPTPTTTTTTTTRPTG